MAFFKDPDGNQLMLHRRYGPRLDVERVDFVSVLTHDIPRAKQFYGETLGLPIETEGKNDMEFTLGQVTLDVFNPGKPFVASDAGIAIRVPDVAAARSALEAKGVEFEGETRDTGVCHLAFFKDPDGNVLMLHRRYAARD
jgi:catechol 2,3-dioxygenase-like lactoylglutathione lyase family enzyme